MCAGATSTPCTHAYNITSCWQRKHTLSLTVIRQEKMKLSLFKRSDFLTHVCSGVCVCVQFYSILDGDEDMLFLHVDNPGGNRPVHT